MFRKGVVVAFVFLLYGCKGGSVDDAKTGTVQENPLALYAANGIVDLSSFEIGLDDFVVSCMKGAGFEFYPEVRSPEPVAREVSLESVGEYGLGISTLYFDAEFVGAGLFGAADGGGENPSRPDPETLNDTYRQSLDRSAQEIYGETLDHCELSAFQELDEGGFSLLSDEEALGQAVLEVVARFEADDDVIEYRRRVEECLALGGFEISSTSEAIELIDDLLATEVFSTIERAEESGEVLSGLPEDGKTALGRVQSEEVRLAVGLAECGALRSQFPADLVAVRSSIADDVLSEMTG